MLKKNNVLYQVYFTDCAWLLLVQIKTAQMSSMIHLKLNKTDYWLLTNLSKCYVVL